MAANNHKWTPDMLTKMADMLMEAPWLERHMPPLFMCPKTRDEAIQLITYLSGQIHVSDTSYTTLPMGLMLQVLNLPLYLYVRQEIYAEIDPLVLGVATGRIRRPTRKEIENATSGVHDSGRHEADSRRDSFDDSGDQGGDVPVASSGSGPARKRRQASRKR
jgi:hypothetical protein